MSLETRMTLIKEIEQLRGSNLLCYLTSLRPNVTSMMSDDAVRVMFDHLLLLPKRPMPRKSSTSFCAAMAEVALSLGV